MSSRARRSLHAPGARPEAWGPRSPRKHAGRQAAHKGNAAAPHIDLRPLKSVAKGLPPGNPARELILEEPDWLPWSEYCVKVVVWFQLIKNADRK